MPADSVYSDDIRLLDDLTRLKLKVIQKKLNTNSQRDSDVITPPRRRQYHGRRYADTPDSERSITPPPPERRRERFYKKIDRRNELLHKLWEELGDGGLQQHRRGKERYLPPLTPRRDRNNAPIFAFGEKYSGTGNTKKDLMELMLIQNAQLQQWLMTQSLSKRALSEDDAPHHYHHYYGDPRAYPLPPIKKSDAGAQYPQDFFSNPSRAQSPQEPVSPATQAQRGKSRRK